MIFSNISHRVGAWAITALMYGDMTGMDEWEEAAFKLWHDHVTQPWMDADDNTWVFAHWSAGDFDDFATDEIMGLMGSTVDVTAHFTLANRTPAAQLSN
jgi:hypothetical protein